MTYIWINPVTESMYESGILDAFLKAHDLDQVRCETDWGRIVKDKYKKLTEESGETVADARCPMASGLVKDVMKVAKIEPILIHCAREISVLEDLRDGKKIITTPCRSLADMGNALKLKDTRFVTWNGLLKELGQSPKGKVIESSPIPPGFFKELGFKTESLTGREDIEQYVKGGEWKTVRLVEMLYCHRGCHNGDGVVKDEA